MNLAREMRKTVLTLAFLSLSAASKREGIIVKGTTTSPMLHIGGGKREGS